MAPTAAEPTAALSAGAPPTRTDRWRRGPKRAFWWSLPGAVVLLVVAVKLMSLAVVSTAALDAASDGHYLRAQHRWHLLETLNVVDRWKAPFGVGTAALQGGDWATALTHLQRAYDLAPEVPADVASLPAGTQVPRCDILTNTALAHEGAGDDALADAKDEVQQMQDDQAELDASGQTADPTDPTSPDPEAHRDAAITALQSAIDAYDAALAARGQDGCAVDTDAKQREQDSRDEAQQLLDQLQAPNSSDDSSSPEDPSDSDDSGDLDDSGDSDQSDGSGSDDQGSDDGSGSDDSSDDGDSSDGSSDPSTSPSPSGSPSSDPGTGSDDPDLSPSEQQRRDELKQRQQQAQEEGEEMQQWYGSDGGTGSGSGTGKNW